MEMFTVETSTGRKITLCSSCLKDWEKRFGLRVWAPEKKHDVSCTICRRAKEDQSRNDCFCEAA